MWLTWRQTWAPGQSVSAEHLIDGHTYADDATDVQHVLNKPGATAPDHFVREIDMARSASLRSSLMHCVVPDSEVVDRCRLAVKEAMIPLSCPPYRMTGAEEGSATLPCGGRNG